MYIYFSLKPGDPNAVWIGDQSRERSIQMSSSTKSLPNKHLKNKPVILYDLEK